MPQVVRARAGSLRAGARGEIEALWHETMYRNMGECIARYMVRYKGCDECHYAGRLG